MTKREKSMIISSLEKLTDDELKNLYYDSLNGVLGGNSDIMVDLDYDIRDIEEARLYERFLLEKCHLIQLLCSDRGIDLF